MNGDFEARITRLPRAYDLERGADALAFLPDLGGPLAELVKGAAGSSPYLADLCRREGAWLAEALSSAPEAAFDAVLAAPVADVMVDLRRKKARAAALIALADLAGVWSLEEVTGALTRLADHAVDMALRDAVGTQLRRGKLPGQGEDDLATAGGLVVLAMGKMGAHELNYSSDIDLICLFDETRFDPDDYAEARTGFVKAVRRMAQILSDRTAGGYVFRTDLRLRPDASVTPVAISMEAAERYYESFGRTWERAAFIKARACAGDISAGERFLDALTPFVWRRHLDYAAIRDAQDMRLRIRDHKGLTRPISHLGHDLKLGQGGIREIEFFTQTRQLIAGGRDPDLRDNTTVGALAQLAAKGWVPEADVRQLQADYRAHREAEHRVQMVADQQTHCLPETEADFARLAALSGAEPAEYANQIEARLHRVAGLTDVLFQPAQSGGQAQEGGPETELLTRWSGYPALRSPRAVEILKRVWPRVEARLDKATNPEEALSHFDAFLRGLPAGVQLFSLFEANPHLLDLVIDIVDTAPELGQYLTRNAGVFDAVIGGQFFGDWPGEDALVQGLAGMLREEEDYEKRLDRARIWAKEWNFRVGVHLLRGLADAETAGRQYADVAGAIVGALWPVVVAEFAVKHGPEPGRGAGVVAMGSLGAGRLTATSDLDLIVVFDAGDIESSDGPRPLATRTYFARLTQALVTALSAPTAEGRLYQVDMRLRPSGRQGPVATSLTAFTAYQKSEAWTWEHLALTRARPLAGDASLLADIEAVRCEVLALPRDPRKVRGDVGEMRTRLHEAKPARHWLDVGNGAGGLQDIDLLAQSGVLVAGGKTRHLAEQIDTTAHHFEFAASDVAVLHAAKHLFWTVRIGARLVFGEATPEDIGAGAAGFLLRITELPTLKAVEAALSEARTSVEGIVTRHMDA
ncbi:MAG: glutamine-synthetase adenylyltransferase [Pseudomonadota bacterium]